jgi:hypothetical protein
MRRALLIGGPQSGERCFELSCSDLVPGAGGVNVIGAPVPAVDGLAFVVEDVNLVAARALGLDVLVDGALGVCQGRLEGDEGPLVDGAPGVVGDSVEVLESEHQGCRCEVGWRWRDSIPEGEAWTAEVDLDAVMALLDVVVHGSGIDVHVVEVIPEATGQVVRVDQAAQPGADVLGLLAVELGVGHGQGCRCEVDER